MTSHIPFVAPFRASNEQEYLQEALRLGIPSGDGAFSVRCRNLLTALVGGRPFLTTSGSAALELATLVAGVGPGDEVIVPSFTFSSVANAVVLRGATPVFVDVEPGTLNIDPDRVRDAIGPRTKAVIAVHYAGVICDVEKLSTLTRHAGILLIEDAAHAIGSRWAGAPAGSFGDLAAFSFHYTKNVTCGEGGALIVNAPDLVPRTEIAFDKGTNRSAMMKGLVDKYSWIDAGASFTLGELNAALLAAQLEALDEINKLRLGYWQRYREACVRMQGIEVPRAKAGDGHNAHLFHVLLASEVEQEAFISAMRRRGINAPFHYVPLHSSSAGLRFGRVAGPMTVTDTSWNRLVRLPLYPSMGDAVERVIEATAEVLQEIRTC